MAHLFGTDGVRGKAGEFPLDVATIRRLGAALVRALRHDGSTPQAIEFLAGRDTRESGAWIERELAFGIQSQGGSYTSTGVVPTPAIAYLTPRLRYSAGVVISASHNLFEDNGIKVFSGAGEKFAETLERHVESIIADTSWAVPDDAAGPVAPDLAHARPSASVLAEGHGAHQRVLGLARIQAGVLHHDGHVGLDDAGERRLLRNRLGVVEFVETQVSRAVRLHREGVGADRLAVLVVDVDAHLRVAIGMRRSASSPMRRPMARPTSVEFR